MAHPNVLVPELAILVVVDVQERFRPAIAHFAEMLAGSIRLVRTFRALDLPIVVTEQYPRGLGRTVPELLEALGSSDAAGASPATSSIPAGAAPIIEKTAFSACGAPGLLDRIGARRQCVVCGIETHVCVQQSVHDLLEAGFSVHLAVDAVGSRRDSDRDVALRRMERSGALLTTTEAVAFELLRDARHPRFKEVQALFK